MVEEKNWFCENCQRQMSEKMAKYHAQTFYHSVKMRIPLEKRIVCQSNKGGNLFVNQNGERFGIQLYLLVFKNPATHLEGLTDPQLSLMGSISNWEYVGIVNLSGNLDNISKKLSYASGQQSVKITPEELEKVICDGIKAGKFEEFGKNLLKMHIVLDTSLKNISRNAQSKWVIATLKQLDRTFVDEIAQREELGRRARLLKTLQPVVGG